MANLNGEAHVLCWTPWDVCDIDHVVFTTPKNDSDFIATVEVKVSSQLTLPYTPQREVESLEITTTICYFSEVVFFHTVSVPQVDDAVKWLHPAELAKTGPLPLISVVIDEACQAWHCCQNGEGTLHDNEEELHKFLCFLAILDCQDKLFEHLFEQGEIDTCFGRDTDGQSLEASREANPAAPSVFRYMTSGSTLEAEFCGFISDTMSGHRWDLRQRGTPTHIVDDFIKSVPATTKSHSGYRFVNERANNSRMFALHRLFDLMGVDDYRHGHFYDDSEACCNCGGYIDAGYGRPGCDDAVFVEAEGYLCRHCAEADIDGLVQWAKDQTPDEIREAFPGWLERVVYDRHQVPDSGVGCVARWVIPGLEAAGYERFDGEYSNGIREGCNDDPQAVAKAIDDTKGVDQQFVFVITSSGDPFETRFAVWCRPVCDICEEESDDA